MNFTKGTNVFRSPTSFALPADLTVDKLMKLMHARSKMKNSYSTKDHPYAMQLLR